MKQDNIIKIFLISLITLVLLSIFGFTYAYFSLEIEGTPKDIVMTTGDLRLEYKDETELSLADAVPGDSISKVITVKNVGTKNATYSLYWGNLINTIENYELHVTLNCKSYTNYGETTQTESGTCDSIYRAVPISSTLTTSNIKGNISIDPNVTHEYTVTVTFDNKPYSQNDNLNKTFRGKIGIQEYTAPEVYNCTFDGELTQGAEYVNGQYTYRYMQEGIKSNSLAIWGNINIDGWGVQLTDKTSTDSVTSKVCTYINDKPVISMSNMFYRSQATIIDLSNINTSEVTNMNGMFGSCTALTTLDVSNFDTRKVTSMSDMFANINVSKLDLSNFDTSNVTDMSDMFNNSNIPTLDLSSFNTNHITRMSYMFNNTSVTNLDLSSFNTSNVTDMRYMFQSSTPEKIDLSSFDTSNVKSMYSMFYKSKVKILNLSNFNTSKVTNMASMFQGCEATTINVSNFDTSKVTNMNAMFAYNKAQSIKGLENFDTSKVTSMSYMFIYSRATDLNVSNFDTSNTTTLSAMFYGTKVLTIDVSNFNTSKVINMSDMFNYTQATEIKGLEKFDTSKVVSMSGMFYESKAKQLNLSNFNTSNVTDMSRMFFKSSAEILDLSKFNTSRVTNMKEMFKFNRANSIIGLENFDTSKVTNMSGMFMGCSLSLFDLSNFEINDSVDISGMFVYAKATTGYAKDQTTADKFNDSSVTNIPSTLKFTVK